MARRIRRALHAALALCCALTLSAAPAAAQGLPSIAEKTRGLERQDGLIPLYWDAQAGKLWMEIPRVGQEMIYQVSLPAGLGSNDIGLDRGQLGETRIVRGVADFVVPSPSGLARIPFAEKARWYTELRETVERIGDSGRV